MTTRCVKPTNGIEPDIQSRILTIRASTAFHDRFLVVDSQRLYLFGASLKDLGKKCFAFTKLDASEIPRIVERSAKGVCER